jgi:glycosyltransferase involved in cell wall biosynthesis
MPEVTVLMTVFNGEKFLKESIESILNQTFKDFEFLIVDDCSEDRSIEIIKSYKDKRIKLIENNQNSGISRSRNKGIGFAEGKYIAIIDHDDISLPERLKKQVMFMNKNPHIAASSVWAEVFGNNKGIWKAPLKPEEIKCHLLFGCSLPNSGAIIRRSIFLEERILYNEDFDSAEDYDLWIRIAEKFPMANMGEILIKYRSHNTQASITRKEEQKVKTEKILKKLLLNIGINPTAGELNLHSKIGTWDLENSLSFLNDAEVWLNKIHLANKKKNIYSEEILLEVIAHRWWMTCKYASSYGLVVWKRFWNSSLSKHNTLSHRDKIKFFLKALSKKRIFKKF